MSYRQCQACLPLFGRELLEENRDAEAAKELEEQDGRECIYGVRSTGILTR